MVKEDFQFLLVLAGWIFALIGTVRQGIGLPFLFATGPLMIILAILLSRGDEGEERNG